jgi:hypothetical protein
MSLATYCYGRPREDWMLGAAFHIADKMGILTDWPSLGGLSIQCGDLPAECLGVFVRATLSSFTIPPNGQGGWLVVVEFRVTRPGTCAISSVKIAYSTNSDTGWQYDDLDVAVHVSNPPLPGPAPVATASVYRRP